VWESGQAAPSPPVAAQSCACTLKRKPQQQPALQEAEIEQFVSSHHSFCQIIGVNGRIHFARKIRCGIYSEIPAYRQRLSLLSD
jgi:hypothetical protein